LLATWYRFPAVTRRLFVDFRRPVPINTELLVRANFEREHDRHVHVSGELVDGDDVLAHARCAFVHVPLEHFLRTREGRAAAAKWEQRLAAEDGS
jgi:acyl-CoA thioesterase FadM